MDRRSPGVPPPPPSPSHCHGCGRSCPTHVATKSSTTPGSSARAPKGCSPAGTALSVSLDEIAEHAGVGPRAVYRHFPTKDAVIAASPSPASSRSSRSPPASQPPRTLEPRYVSNYRRCSPRATRVPRSRAPSPVPDFDIRPPRPAQPPNYAMPSTLSCAARKRSVRSASTSTSTTSHAKGGSSCHHCGLSAPARPDRHRSVSTRRIV